MNQMKSRTNEPRTPKTTAQDTNTQTTPFFCATVGPNCIPVTTNDYCPNCEDYFCTSHTHDCNQ